jgi:hypothetical protein
MKSIIEKMTALGYEVEAAFVDCDIEECIRREKAGGRNNRSAFYSQDDTMSYFTSAFANT